ncbi:MAG: hypothetical protein DI629_11695 [Mesorhizobium amorphae]|nr:MAG: hypothetical protein DI629_11695 [Mesorhizobium amorphae]
MPSRALMLCGTDEPQPETRLLVAGPLEATLEAGNLRAIRWHGLEAIRGIAWLVRDENWGTYAPELSDFTLQETEAGFSLRFRGTCRSREGAMLSFETAITGEAAGRLVFDVRAVPNAPFSTNRTGFNILHPVAGVAGEAAEVEHVDGTVEQSRFPLAIDPAQPFLAMRRITHHVAPGVSAFVLMGGDSFEMEDQRNWTDASFKTYVRPLALPWPYVLPAGKANHQRITVMLEGTPPAGAARKGEAPTLAPARGEAFAMPALGLVVTPEEVEATLAVVDRLRAVGPRQLILSFDPREGHGAGALQGFARLLAAYPASATLEFTVPCLGDFRAEIAAAGDLVRQAGLALDAVAICPAPDLQSTPPGSRWPDCPPLEDIYEAARRAFPAARLGGGMFSYFTELNRKRVPADRLDFVTHTTSPLVHAADDTSVMQTLEALPFVTASVRAIFGDKPYRIGPSTIGMRHNPYGASLAASTGDTRRTMVSDDPRQRGLFAAAWTVGYAAAVLPARLEALTLGALTGPFGLVEGDTLRPAFHAMKALAALSSPVRAWVPDRSASLSALGDSETVLVANLSTEPAVFTVPGLASLRRLDETTFSHAAGSAELAEEVPGDGPVALGGYGVAFCRIGA